MKTKFKILLVAAALASCNTPKHIAKMQAKYCPTASDKITDSVTTKVERHDSTIYVTTPTQSVYIASPCDSIHIHHFDTIVVHNGIKQEIKSDANGLIFSCQADSLIKVIAGLNVTIHEKETEKETKIVAPICNLKHVTSFEEFCVKFFWGFVIIFVLAIIILFIYLYLNTIKKIP